MARKTMSIQIEESLQDAFRNKCKSENLKYSEVAEALLQAYVEGNRPKRKPTPSQLEPFPAHTYLIVFSGLIQVEIFLMQILHLENFMKVGCQIRLS